MTLIVNMFGGPGVGKSTLATGVFHQLKLSQVSCEYVPEVAKSMTWEKRAKTLQCQFYVTAKQYRDTERLLDQVDVIVTDSSFLLGPMYTPDWYPESFTTFVLDMFRKMRSINFYIERAVPYDPVGRNQNHAEAIEIDNRLLAFLKNSNVPIISVPGECDKIPMMVERIRKEVYRMKWDQRYQP